MTARTLPAEQSLSLPTFTVASEGTVLDGTFNLVSITIDKAANRIPSARLMFKDGSAATEDFPLSAREELVPGRAIEIAAGYHNDNQTVFKGVVVRHGVRVKGDRSSYLMVECKDKAYTMTVGPKNRYFADTTDSAALEEIIEARGLGLAVEPTNVTHRSLMQYATTDWDFLVSRAEANGKLVIVDDGTVNVAAPDLASEPVAELLFGATLITFDLTLDATHQHDDVFCLAWDPANQEVTEGEAQTPSGSEPGNLSAADLADSVTQATIRYQHGAHLSTGELQAWASARRQKDMLSKIRGLVKCKGLGPVKPGTRVEVAGVGTRLSGVAFVSGVRHVLGPGTWEMSLQVGLSPELFTAETDVSELPASGLLPAVSGLQVGVVTQLQNDPDGEHRILVRMPVVDANAEGTWARLASWDAGADRGAFFRPEIGDEVVLGFFNNDPRHAVVLGSLHSSSFPAPVTESDDNNEKGYYSRSGLKLVFNDDLPSLRIETPNGNVFEVNDDTGTIVLEDESGNRMEMSSSGITLDSAGDIALNAGGDIKLQGSKIALSAQSSFKASGNSGAEVSSSGMTDIKGSMVNIN